MIHIFKTSSGFTVNTVASSDSKELLSSSGRQNFATIQGAFKNIRAQMKEFGSVNVYVQDDTKKEPIVLIVTPTDATEAGDRLPESTKETRRAKTKKTAPKKKKA